MGRGNGLSWQDEDSLLRQCEDLLGLVEGAMVEWSMEAGFCATVSSNSGAHYIAAARR